jgi:uncharacterized membrane protein YjgN (DUF898 family)
MAPSVIQGEHTMHSLDPAPAAPVVVAPGDTPDTAPAHHLTIRFTGSGSEYFRIWIVNLLLTLLTVGLYYPYARVRRLRYFYGNTLIGGHALDFHARPASMLRGYLLVAMLLGLYHWAGSTSLMAGLVALLALAALWPALYRSAQRFRMANTSWRGLRFGFDGSTGGAYRAWLLIALAWCGSVSMGLISEHTEEASPAHELVGLIGLASLLISFALPYGLWQLKAYQHNHFLYAGETARFSLGASSIYGLIGKIVLIGIAGMVLIGVVVFLPIFGFDHFHFVPSPTAVLAGFLLLTIVGTPWLLISTIYTARLQNLCWSATRTHSLRFDSRLSVRALLWLNLKNWLAIVFTLGFYWPFAAIAITRLRLEAVTIETVPAFEALLAERSQIVDGASGDAMGDLLGIDAGL